MLLEDGEIASGETGRSTAHVANGIDDRYYEVAKKYGNETALRVAERCDPLFIDLTHEPR